MYSHHCRQGYDRAHRDLGLPLDHDLVVDGGLDRGAGRQGVDRLLSLATPPKALICGNDMIAIGAMDRLREMDLVVGKDVAVIGCDDQPLAQFSSPPLTTFAAPVRRAGRHLAELLLQVIEGASPDGLQELWRPELVVRRSDGGDQGAPR